MLKIGDYIKVKNNIMDPDTGKYDLSGWQGRVTEIDDEEDGEEKIITIQWDAQTLKSMPPKFIQESMEDGYEYAEMSLWESELELTEPPDTEQDRNEIIQTLNDENSWLDLGEQGQRIKEVEDACEDDFALMDHWFEHLENNIKLPIKVKYVGDSKNSLQYGADLLLIGFEDADDFYGVIGGAQYNRRRIQVLLCDVQVLEVDKNSEALDDYVVWFANR